MTIYIFISFNFLNPGNINAIFRDRILDTAIAGIIASFVAYFVLPVWEHTQNIDLMKKSLNSNLNYFQAVLEKLKDRNLSIQFYKLKRKDAIIDLANLSDNFQRMLSDPKNQRRKMETVHQFVNTSHLITAYVASLSQYASTEDEFPEIDFEVWEKKISAELLRTKSLLDNEITDEEIKKDSHLQPEDLVDELLIKRKTEIEENEFFDIRDPNRVTRLTELRNIREILELLYDTSREQRKVMENHRKYA